MLSVTELDFKIIEQMYEWKDMEIFNFHYFYRGFLPKPIIEATLKLYEDKTKLKNVAGSEVEYQVSKGMLNSLYGMCVTDPCKDVVVYDNEEGWVNEKTSTQELIEKYNTSYGRFLYYAWGIWITAYARYNLFTGILECKEDYIYADTDSLKIFNRDKHKEYFENYNKSVQERICKCLDNYEIPRERMKPKTIKGVEKPLGVWDFEGDYDRFKTLGAKRYLYEENGELHLTLAGVSKKEGLSYLKWKYKTNDRIFKNFTDKLNFPSEYQVKKGKELITKNASGKLCHTYIDIHKTGSIIDYLGNEGYFDELSSVHLEPTGYDLSLEANFVNYLMGIQDSSVFYG